MSSWADLPPGLLTDIASRLTDIAELTSFSSVCPSWRTAAFAATLRRCSPWILFPDRRLFSVDTGRIYPFPSPAAAAAANGCQLFPSPSGKILAVRVNTARSPVLRLASVDGSSLRIPTEGMVSKSLSVVDPFDGDSILRLPKPSFTLSSGFGWDVSPQGVVVVAGTTVREFRSGRMGYPYPWLCRPGETEWTEMDNILLPILPLDSMSVTYRGSKFFLFDSYRMDVNVIELDPASLAVAAVVKIAARVPKNDYPDPFFGVSAAGELMVLLWWKDSKRTKFFRAEYRGEETAWKEADGIGEHALFLGGYRALVVDGCELTADCKLKAGGVYCSHLRRREMGGTALAVVTNLENAVEKLVLSQVFNAVEQQLYTMRSMEDKWMMPRRRLVSRKELSTAISSSVAGMKLSSDGGSVEE